MSMSWRSCCATRSITCSARTAPPCGCVCRHASSSSRPRDRCACGDRRCALVVPPADGARIADRLSGPGGARGCAAFAELVAEEPGAGLLAITVPTDCMPAGSRPCAHAATASAPPSPYRAGAGAAGAAAALVTVLDGHPATPLLDGRGASVCLCVSVGVCLFVPVQRHADLCRRRHGFGCHTRCLRSGSVALGRTVRRAAGSCFCCSALRRCRLRARTT